MNLAECAEDLCCSEKPTQHTSNLCHDEEWYTFLSKTDNTVAAKSLK